MRHLLTILTLAAALFAFGCAPHPHGGYDDGYHRPPPPHSNGYHRPPPPHNNNVNVNNSRPGHHHDMGKHNDSRHDKHGRKHD